MPLIWITHTLAATYLSYFLNYFRDPSSAVRFLARSPLLHVRNVFQSMFALQINLFENSLGTITEFPIVGIFLGMNTQYTAIGVLSLRSL